MTYTSRDSLPHCVYDHRRDELRWCRRVPESYADAARYPSPPSSLAILATADVRVQDDIISCTSPAPVSAMQRIICIIAWATLSFTAGYLAVVLVTTLFTDVL